jgi:hypothetical protein
MNALIETLRQSDGMLLKNEDGLEDHLKLLPPLSANEMRQLEKSIPCPLPEEMRELFAFSRGFEGGDLLEPVIFSGLFNDFDSFGLIPCAITVAGDGAGNYWVVDLISSSTSWAPIYFFAHDAPVLAYQSDSLEHFVRELLRGSSSPWQSEILDVSDRVNDRIWSENPGVLSFEECHSSSDTDLRQFATSLDETWQIIDLRNAKIGDGFSWGRYGPRTVCRRFGEKRIFAYQRRSFGRRLIDAMT